jgi:phage terminase large subunit-like protein
MAFDLAQLAALERQLRQTRIADYFPETGPLRRELYVKHLEFFAAGAVHQERAFVAANRVGKSLSGCYEATCHMIGWYPSWWCGRRFDRPVVVWVSGEDAKAVRETLQPHLLGPVEDPGTGLIPGDRIVRAPTRGGIPDATDFAQIRHSTGGLSRLLFKAYEQGAGSYAGPHVDVQLLDEPPPMAVYSEALTRTMSTVPGEGSGLVMCTFTPLKGLTDVVQMYLPGGILPATETLRKEAWGW